MPIGTLIQKIDRQPRRVRERTADHRPERHRDPDDAAPDADRLRTLTRIGEDVADDRHRDRVEHRAAHALKGAEGDQPAGRGRGAAQERADREEPEPDREDALAPDPVGDGAAQDQQRRQHDRVRVDDPLELRQRRIQVAVDRRQRDVDDRVVQRDQQDAHAADREHLHPATAGQRDGSYARKARLAGLSGLRT